MKKRLIIHPFLFALFPVLSFYLNHWIEATIINVLLLGGLSMVGVIILWVVLFIFIRDAKKTALIASLAALLFFSFGYVRTVLENVYNGPFGFARYRYLFSIWVILCTAGTYGFLHASHRKDQFTRAANNGGVIMVVAAVFAFGVANWNVLGGLVSRGAQQTVVDAPSSVAVTPDAKLPDIYYFITDGYARSDILKEVYEFDNSEFIRVLEQRGFYVPSDSRSNYAQTFLSLTSSLNMDYLTFSPEEKATKSGDDQLIRKKLQHQLENNRVIAFLRSQGYTAIHFGATGWAATARNRNAQMNVSCGLYSEFIVAFTRTTMLEPWPDALMPSGGKHLLCMLDKLAEAPGMGKSPRFVFAHLIAPHPPAWFGPDGELISNENPIDDWTDKEGYRNEVRYLNARLIKLVDTLFEKSRTPPIIVIQADHGSAFFGGASFNSRDWTVANTALIKERMPIFSAFYLPGVDDEEESVLYPSLTPVNIFRIIFNRYFDAKYELLRDKSYFDTYEYPYQLMDVTHHFGK